MRVLLATDGSPQARLATEWLHVFPLPPATEILVVSAVAPPPPVLEGPIPPTVFDTAVAYSQKVADETVATLRPRWPAASARVIDGDPRHVIPATAAEWNADLVVVGARGFGALARLLVGSVSTSVVHHARCPVLVARGRPRELRAAVIAIDGSPQSRAAAGFVAALPLDPALTVRLVGVVERPRAAGASRGLRAMLDQIVEEQRAGLLKVLHEVAVAFEARTRTVECAVRSGSPAREILAAAKTADLVVLGARGLGPIDRLLLGSVSERVLHHAACSVLVMKQPERA